MDADHMPNDWDVLLSCYFDGELSPEEEASLFIELERSNDLQVRFNKMKTLRNAVNKTIANQADISDSTSSVWHSILEKLNQPSEFISDDLVCKKLPIEEDLAEITSAYHDGELAANEITEFETVLSSNKNATTLLKHFVQISKSLGRITEACPVDSSAHVMNQLSSEIPQELDFAHIELLSAHLDRELKTQEVIQLNRLIESSTQAKQQLHTLNALHDLIQTSQQNTASLVQVDLWEKIESQLLSENQMAASTSSKKTQGKLIPLNKTLWLSAPMAAAAALVVLSWPAHQLDSLLGNEISLSDSESSQIASVPRFRNMNLSRLSSNGESLPMIPVVPVMNKAQNSNQATLQTKVILVPTKPILDATARQLASRRVGIKTDATTAFKNKTSRKAPSSEEYLFHALDEQGSGADFSNLMND
jgi:anti-sigma factor RsiW